ncbi:MAG: Flp pilus assembly protein CpaB [SAR324 cluster bacterium]|uniref:Flp pilus assembly protein CpaB n=1 Tax=SAR324 cluster bacterium TaxID=2024889 RepID=A0A7X9IKA5_9DELT|nr:Flp pilus assembly protein CpaB [SAR324 cluster bacterium]
MLDRKFVQRRRGIKRDERERILFIAAAGGVFSLFIIVLVILSTNRPADAVNTMDPSVRGVSASVGMISLYTPEKHVESGTNLSNVKFKEMYWPRNQLPESAVRNLTEVRSMYAKNDLEPGIPLSYTNLSHEAPMESLPLRPGLRAVSIEVDATSGLEGHALPGTLVDVSLTHMVNNELTTTIIVQQARVLSYGGETKAKMDSNLRKNNTVGRTITLEVMPQDALKIQTARQMGRLGLLMRTSDDQLPNLVTEVAANQLTGAIPQAAKKTEKTCTKGRVRLNGAEYIVGCDGQLSQVMN